MLNNNDGKHISHIVETTTCNSHGAPMGYACWGVDFNTMLGSGLAVCGSRIRAAGFVGQISATSLQQRSSGGRTGGRKS